MNPETSQQQQQQQQVVPLHASNGSIGAVRPAVSFRPPCFIKPGADSSTASAAVDHAADLGAEMRGFIKMFDSYGQKVYIEGFLYKYNGDGSSRTRCYAELSGATLSIWDAQVQSPRILPQYFNVSDATVQRQVVERRAVLALNTNHGAKTQQFEAADEATLARWICAIRLSCFESKKLHMLFTLRLLLQTVDPDVDLSAGTRWEAQVQVRMPGGRDWQKHWAVVTGSSHTSKRKTSLFSGGSKKHHHQQQAQQQVQVCLMTSRKSKTPAAVVTDVSHAYAMYPESPQLLDKGLMLRVEGTVVTDGGQAQAGHVLLMTDSRQQLCAGLLAIFDACKLHGRPGTLLSDVTDEQALDYGCTASPRLFLEADDLVGPMDLGPVPPKDIERICLDALQRKLLQPIRCSTRANSLPLITVACDDDSDSHNSLDAPLIAPPLRQRSASDSGESPQDLATYYRDTNHHFPRQIIDSSDEEDAADDSADDDDPDDDDESDSDDEPIGKATRPATTTAATGAGGGGLLGGLGGSRSNSLMPDFDFGNGFDVSASPSSLPASPRRASGEAMLGEQVRRPGSPMSAQSPQQHQERSRNEDGEGKASGKEPLLFDDFSLSMDFAKYMTVPSDPSATRKYSLPSNVRLLDQRESVDRLSSSGAGSSASSFLGPSSSSRRRRSWDQHPRWTDEYDEQPIMDPRLQQQRHPYDDDDDDEHSGGGSGSGSGYDGGPMIPSLSDHFATQNSLLDTYLGDQLTAKEQIQYCRATGQPFIQLDSNKERVPEGGFVGMISRREKHRRQGNNNRVSERVQQHHVDLEREKERRLFEQRQQQWMNHHQMFMYANGCPPGAMPPPMFPPPGVPYVAMQSPGPMTPTSPIPGPHGAPPYLVHPAFSPQAAAAAAAAAAASSLAVNGPRSPSLSSPVSPSSRRSSRPLLDEIGDDTPVLLAPRARSPAPGRRD